MGQHFMKDQSAIQKIVEGLDLKEGETIIEIGPGKGALTQKLETLKGRLKIILIEKDGKLASELKSSGLSQKTELVVGDALEILPVITSNLEPVFYKITGNIPYYITGRLMRVLSDLKNKPAVCIFTVQREVAERMAAMPPKMNRLAASVQFWAKVEVLSIVPKNSFFPPPEVESAIIRLKTRSDKPKVRAEDYYETVKVLFKQPRKTILNNLKEGDGGLSFETETLSLLQALEINPKSRPHNLLVEQIAKIAELSTGK